MVKLAANISWLWTGSSTELGLRSARAKGFKFVESLAPYTEPAESWERWLEDFQLKLVLINTPSGSSSDLPVRGLAAFPRREDEFKKVFEHALDYSNRLGAPIIHVTAGPTLKTELGISQQSCYEKNLYWACGLAESNNTTLTIEPLSPRDSPGAFMADLGHALRTIEAVNHPCLKLQFDLYHQQILHGDIVQNLRRTFSLIGHIQVAGVPNRDEPCNGELNFERVVTELESLHYEGFIGCEYRPETSAEEGLDRWASKYLQPTVETGTNAEH